MKQLFSEARLNKDKNYDGKFLFGVRTTGIFCRPSCPSPTAREENVVYFQSIFEALEGGFRPCFRCRPDIEVEYYNGNLTGTFIVNSALKLIYDGYMNYNSLGDLSDELGISDRHLRKLFIDNLGVPPVKIVRYHKALFAKRLLNYSDQSITEIAFASGFGSIRQFNDVFKNTFGVTPTSVRNEIQKNIVNPNQASLLLKYKKPFNFNQILSFMKPRAMEGVEVITGKSYSRTFRTDNTKGYFTVTDNPSKSGLELKIVCEDIRCYMEIHNRVRKVFDLDTDFTFINDKLSKDRILSIGMTDGHVPRLPVAFDPFEFVIRAILGQQVSVQAATTLAARVAKKAGIKADTTFPEGLDHFFPTPAELLEIDLNDIGLPKTRQETVKTVVKAILNKDFKLTANQTLEDFHRDFSSLKGIGDWTVNYVAMRGLGMSDSFPAGDLGVIKALSENDNKLSSKEITNMADKWRPYRSYATLCLWNIFSASGQKDK